MNKIEDYDVLIIEVCSLDKHHPKTFTKPWLIKFADGSAFEFDTETKAQEFQRGWRVRHGFHPITGARVI